MTPNADTGEEMALNIAPEIVRRHLGDAALIHVAGSDMTRSNEVAQPLGGERIDLVVIGCQRAPSDLSSRTMPQKAVS